MKPGIHPDYRPVIFLDTQLEPCIPDALAIDTKAARR